MGRVMEVKHGVSPREMVIKKGCKGKGGEPEKNKGDGAI